jgi:hypothetical protein
MALSAAESRWMLRTGAEAVAKLTQELFCRTHAQRGPQAETPPGVSRKSLVPQGEKRRNEYNVGWYREPRPY